VKEISGVSSSFLAIDTSSREVNGTKSARFIFSQEATKRWLALWNVRRLQSETVNRLILQVVADFFYAGCRMTCD
jgi:hypothetical protein